MIGLLQMGRIDRTPSKLVCVSSSSCVAAACGNKGDNLTLLYLIRIYILSILNGENLFIIKKVLLLLNR